MSSKYSEIIPAGTKNKNKQDAIHETFNLTDAYKEKDNKTERILEDLIRDYDTIDLEIVPWTNDAPTNVKTMKVTKKKRKTKRRALSPIYEKGALESKRRTLRRSQPPLLPRGQRRNTITKSVIENARKKKEAYEQLGCFGKFCKNIKRKLTRRAGARRRRATRKKRTRKRRKKRK